MHQGFNGNNNRIFYFCLCAIDTNKLTYPSRIFKKGLLFFDDIFHFLHIASPVVSRATAVPAKIKKLAIMPQA
jgi:hypothetical protein